MKVEKKFILSAPDETFEDRYQRKVLSKSAGNELSPRKNYTQHQCKHSSIK